MLINVDELIENLFPEWVDESHSCTTFEKTLVATGKPTILLVEDSDFFRQQVKNFLIEDGYNVLEAHDGQEALEILKENYNKISLVLTDVEMPRMDGLSLTKIIKSDSRFSHLPVVALTSLASDEDIERGKEVGVDEYQIKLDRENLLKSVRNLVLKEV